jgi:hypothetical protein
MLVTGLGTKDQGLVSTTAFQAHANNVIEAKGLLPILRTARSFHDVDEWRLSTHWADPGLAGERPVWGRKSHSRRDG